MMAEYNMTLRQAIWGIPLTAAFALMAPRAARHGIDIPGPADAAASRARARVKAHYAATHTITP